MFFGHRLNLLPVAFPLIAFGLMLMLSSFAVNAQARGIRVHGFQSGHHYAWGNHGYGRARRGAIGAWPWYGGVLAVPPYEPTADTYVVSEPIIVAPPPPPLTCHRTIQTVTVPAEGGGTRQITITRC